MKINVHSERYQRQVLLPEIGEQGQELLADAKVLVVGAGGLGCPVLQYLAAAGVGYIGIADGDVVSLSNLHRQVLYSLEDVEHLKVKAAAKAVHRINPEVEVKQYPFYLHNVLALELLPKYDIVVDCTDNFATRYMLNDACALMQKPLVMAALTQWEGQLAVLHAGANGTAGINYRDIFPEPPGEHEVPNCAQAGVLGVLPGIIGTLQAAEVIKYLTGVGALLSKGMLHFDLKTGSSWIMEVAPSASRTGPADRQAFLLTNYEWYCGARDVAEIGSRELPTLMEQGAVFVDVRELQERPELPVPHQRLPLSELRNRSAQVEGKEVVVVCHHGIRSIEAVRLLSQWAPAGQKLYSLKGGIMALSAINQSK
ncbi:adenylyltransferase and sulfurtransferase [Cnuella takakiae]|uniref:Molybdopterin-synthase adenylyltransferase n=1 Tax=Cnuella takakiae TaxID=1302690 RepID=A0A1M4YHA6_9BACT|nr:HesA/MoeB/ThiF family protein [Cnuella takakiae]OLY93148.1 hypothetical protein BUE76_15570 [Cnuella takakiae]SHF05038.1 adenylyltransferase and sulfurtransferase [Cnuella takakiae]